MGHFGFKRNSLFHFFTALLFYQSQGADMVLVKMREYFQNAKPAKSSNTNLYDTSLVNSRCLIKYMDYR